MKDPFSRQTFMLPVLLTGVYVLVDLVVDHEVNGGYFTWPHLVVGAFVLLLSGALLAWSVKVRRRTDALLHDAREELEARVRGRTAELQQANVRLRAEIAERKRMEHALRLSEVTVRALMNAAFESAVLVDPVGTVLVANEAAARSLGVAIDQMLGVSLFDFFTPDVATARRAHFGRALTTGLPVRFEDVRNGHFFDIQVQPVFDGEGQVIRVAAFGLDVTEHKRVEGELRASEEKYRALFHSMAEGFALYELVYDAQGRPVDWRVLEVNEAYTQHTGLRADQVVGHCIGELFPHEVPKYLAGFARVVAAGVPISFETYASAVGRYHRVSTFPAGGRRFASTFEDISSRHRAEQELRASEEKFAKIFELSPAAIVLLRLETATVLDVNPAFTRILGYPRAEVLGRTWQALPLLSPAEAARILGVAESAGQVTDLELNLVTQTGSAATMLVSLLTLTISDEACLLVMAHDITERKRSEAALLQVQAEVARSRAASAALEERQRLSRELHDSVSQALYGVSLGINTARIHFDGDRAKVREALDYALALAQAGLTEMRALIFELRPDSLAAEGLVSALTQRAAALRTRHELQVGLSLGPEPALPLPAKEALYRIAQEALQNAVKHAQAGQVDIHLDCTAACVTLEVVDDGIGFDCTADFPGHLGLRSMRERAESAGGALTIASAAHGGTRVIVTIPVPIPA